MTRDPRAAGTYTKVTFTIGVREGAARVRDLRAVQEAVRRAIDIAIASCAIAQGASLWRLNPADFAAIPELHLA